MINEVVALQALYAIIGMKNESSTLFNYFGGIFRLTKSSKSTQQHHDNTIEKQYRVVTTRDEEGELVTSSRSVNVLNAPPGLLSLWSKVTLLRF